MILIECCLSLGYKAFFEELVCHFFDFFAVNYDLTIVFLDGFDFRWNFLEGVFSELVGCMFIRIEKIIVK